MKGDNRPSGRGPKPKGNRGRKPKRIIRTFYGLRAEVEAAVAEIMKKNPKLKKKPIEKAIEICLKYDNETQPRSWWFKDDAPLGLGSARQLYYDALEAIKHHEMKLGPASPESMSLSELGDRVDSSNWRNRRKQWSR